MVKYIKRLVFQNGMAQYGVSSLMFRFLQAAFQNASISGLRWFFTIKTPRVIECYKNIFIFELFILPQRGKTVGLLNVRKLT